jgi:hypothetical protein
MIEFVGWRIRLFAVRQRYAAAARTARAAGHFDWLVKEMRWSRLVDRVSPWMPDRGYKRRRLRRLLWLIRFPRRTLRLWIDERIFLVAGHFVYVGPGRYEGNEPENRLKAEWLDANMDLAEETTGEASYFGLFAAAFYDLPVPWSRKRESWLLTTGEQGFVDVVCGDIETIGRLLEEIDNDYGRWHANLHTETDFEDIEEDVPVETVDDVAREHNVSAVALRASLARSHPDASPSEVINQAREIEAEGE